MINKTQYITMNPRCIYFIVFSPENDTRKKYHSFEPIFIEWRGKEIGRGCFQQGWRTKRVMNFFNDELTGSWLFLAEKDAIMASSVAFDDGVKTKRWGYDFLGLPDNGFMTFLIEFFSLSRPLFAVNINHLPYRYI